jgi:hypothetical protein
MVPDCFILYHFPDCVGPVFLASTEMAEDLLVCEGECQEQGVLCADCDLALHFAESERRRMFVTTLSYEMCIPTKKTFAANFVTIYASIFVLNDELKHYLKHAPVSVKKQAVACMFERAYPDLVQAPLGPVKSNAQAFSDMMGMFVLESLSNASEILSCFFNAMENDAVSVRAVCEALSPDQHVALCKHLVEEVAL